MLECQSIIAPQLGTLYHRFSTPCVADPYADAWFHGCACIYSERLGRPRDPWTGQTCVRSSAPVQQHKANEEGAASPCPATALLVGRYQGWLCFRGAQDEPGPPDLLLKASMQRGMVTRGAGFDARGGAQARHRPSVGEEIIRAGEDPRPAAWGKALPPVPRAWLCQDRGLHQVLHLCDGPISGPHSYEHPSWFSSNVS